MGTTVTYIPNANFNIILWEVCLLRYVHPVDLEAQLPLPWDGTYSHNYLGKFLKS